MTNLQEKFQPLLPGETHLTIKVQPFRIEGSRLYVIAKCRCGSLKLYVWKDVKRGHTRSCGCYSKEYSGNLTATHRETNTPLYNTWCGMKGRCYNKNSSHYWRYGGKGIRMCREWKNNYVSFRDWAMKNGWKQGLQVDRVKNNKGYSPDNCRIVTCSKNARNRTSNIHITHNGETKILVEWVEFYGLKYGVVRHRYRNLGLRGDELFSPTPIKKRGQYKKAA